MNLSVLTLRKLVEELLPDVSQRLIRDAFLSGRHDLYLDLGKSGHLLLSAFPGKSRVLFSSPPDESLRTPLPWIDRYVLKAGIVSLSQMPCERVLEFTLSKRDRLGGTTQTRLICELIGRYANVILVDEVSGKIISALRQVGSRQNRVREILPGRPYSPPPMLGRIAPQDVSPAFLTEIFSDAEEPPESAMARRIAGFDMFTAREVLCRAGIDGNPAPEALPHLAETLRVFFTTPPWLNGAAIVRDAEGRNTICAIQPQHCAPLRMLASVSKAIEAVLEEESQTDALRGRMKNIERELSDRLSAIALKIERINADLEDAEHADRYEKYGNILMANIPRIPPGAASVSLPDIFAPSAPPIDIPLNPKRTPVENAQDYIKRGRKARKGAPILAQRLEAGQTEMATLKAGLDRLQTLQSDAEIDNFRTELEQAGWLKAKKQKPIASKKRNGDDIHPRRYRTTDGWTVLVGRNNQENDKLTKSAANDDIFFHAQGCPGSHVILKREGKPDGPPRSTMNEAAGLAAYWSKARGAKTVPVNYTEVRYVQKPRGAPAGLVTIRNEKTIMAHPREIKREDEW